MDESINIDGKEKADKFVIISAFKFFVLGILTFGIYEVYWIYKSWRFFREKEGSEYNSALRTLFSIIFLIPLFNRIRKYSVHTGGKKHYSSVLLYIGYVLTCLLVYLPDHYWFLALLSIIFLINPYRTMNNSIKRDPELIAIVRKGFSIRQTFLVIIGIVWWSLLIFSFTYEVNENTDYFEFEITTSVQQRLK